MIAAMLRKLEANPHRRYKEVLNVEEFNEAVLMIRAAVAYVQGFTAAQRFNGKRVKPPSCFVWHGQSYPLWYGKFLGQIFIANKSGVRLIASGYDVI
jgi:hypothetical protein